MIGAIISRFYRGQTAILQARCAGHNGCVNNSSKRKSCKKTHCQCGQSASSRSAVDNDIGALTKSANRLMLIGRGSRAQRLYLRERLSPISDRRRSSRNMRSGFWHAISRITRRANDPLQSCYSVPFNATRDDADHPSSARCAGSHRQGRPIRLTTPSARLILTQDGASQGRWRLCGFAARYTGRSES